MVAYLSVLYLAVGLGMAIGRSSSDALLFKRFGVEYLPHMLFLTSVLLVIFSAAYAEFTDRVQPARMFKYVVSLTGIFLLATWGAMQGGDGKVAFAVYFLGYGVISEILVVHFNLYVSGFLDISQSKRLSPLINASSRLGGVVGGVSIGLFSSRFPTEHMALVWVLTLVVAFLLIAAYHRGEQRPRTKIRSLKKQAKPFAQIREGFEFARHSRLLQIAGLGLFAMIVLISMQDYLVSTILTRHFRDERDLAAFFGWFFAFTNFMVLLLQMLVANRLMHRFGLKVVSLIYPWSTAVSFALLSLSASFIPAVIGRFNYTGMGPAFRNPAANLFYNALPDYMQGRARALSIGLILPLGLAVSGLLLMWVPKESVGEALAVFGLLLSFVYIYITVVKNRIYANSLARLIQQQVFAGSSGAFKESGRLDERVIRELKQMLRQTEEGETYLAYAEFLLGGAPQEVGILLETLAARPVSVQDRLLPRIAELNPPGWREYARRCLESDDQHLRATALTVLAERGDADALRAIHEWLTHTNPRLRAAAVQACYAVQAPTLHENAEQVLHAMLNTEMHGTIIAALLVVRELRLTSHGEAVRTLLQHLDAGVRAAAIAAAAAIGDTSERLALLANALQDDNTDVQREAEKHAASLMPTTESEYAAAFDTYFSHFRMQSLLASCLAQSELAQRKSILLTIAQRHLQRAWDKKSVAQQTGPLARQVSEASFLCLVLNEEVQRHIAFALENLALLDEAQVARAISAALASRDRRLRAQALESLRHIENNALIEWLLPLIESEQDGAKWAHPAPAVPRNLNELIAWCEQQGGQWLRQCAAAMEKETNRATPV